MLSAFGSVHPAFRKDKTIMEKMTREDVDNMILESFGSIGEGNIFVQFLEEYDGLLSDFKKADLEIDRGTASYLSCIIVAQMNAINIMREVLYKIFCKDETETKQEITEEGKHVSD